MEFSLLNKVTIIKQQVAVVNTIWKQKKEK